MLKELVRSEGWHELRRQADARIEHIRRQIEELMALRKFDEASAWSARVVELRFFMDSFVPGIIKRLESHEAAEVAQAKLLAAQRKREEEDANDPY